MIAKGATYWRFCGIGLLSIAGCDGPQSALQPAGEGARDIANLFWWMLGGGSAIWLVVIGLAIYSVRSNTSGISDRSIRLWIIGGGAIVPTIVLSGLLLFSLPMLPELLAPAPADALQIEVRAKMWWWRVRYLSPSAEAVELANEIRLPVGEPVEFRLASDDVIHAFWIPSLGGKVDMIPGRITRLKLVPTNTGVFRGACAEYCGLSHARMNFDVIVMEKEDFTHWLEQQRAPVDSLTDSPSNSSTTRGQHVFFQTGCHACHTIRGTQAHGTIGPDLTHVGSRHSLAAGALENEPDHFADWISHVSDIKPGSKMPNFDTLPDDDLHALAEFLESLQ